jgi:hypothetical protein
MIIAYVPLLFVVIGILMYALSANPKVSAIGFAMFQCAFLVTMFSFAGKTISLLR